MSNFSTNYILRIMNITTNADDIAMCRRELKRRGYGAMYDEYVGEWVLV